jgi:Cyclic nucleotide-binding domain
MEQIRAGIRQMIDITDEELDQLLKQCYKVKFKRLQAISVPGEIPNTVYFINSGALRVLITDKQGVEHTVYFAMENQFIADYSSYILQQPSLYTLQALKDIDAVAMSRSAVEWGYKNLKQGEKLGRLIAEFYFIYQDNRIKNEYARTPKERYESITDVFPNIHNLVPQHMIASYLGITPVHLSRLKKSKT